MRIESGDDIRIRHMPGFTMFNPHDIIVPFDTDSNTLPNFTHFRIEHKCVYIPTTEAEKNSSSTLLLSRVNGGPLITSPPLSVFALL